VAGVSLIPGPCSGPPGAPRPARSPQDCVETALRQPTALVVRGAAVSVCAAEAGVLDTAQRARCECENQHIVASAATADVCARVPVCARCLHRAARRTIEDHDTLFVLAEIAHFVGIGLLGFKMYSKRSAAGASALCGRLHRGMDGARSNSSVGLTPAQARTPGQVDPLCAVSARAPPSQHRPVAADADPDHAVPGHPAVLQVRAVAVVGTRRQCACEHHARPAVAFVVVSRRPALLLGAPHAHKQPHTRTRTQHRSFMMEYDIHTVLDALTLVATSAVIYALLATPIKTTYQVRARALCVCVCVFVLGCACVCAGWARVLLWNGRNKLPAARRLATKHARVRTCEA
jgi:hypothetical protein